MIKVYKFDSFTSYIVSPSVFTTHSSIIEGFRMNRRDGTNEWIIPLPKGTEVENIDKESLCGVLNLKDKLNSTSIQLTFKDKLFIHPDCTIPRVKVTQKYTRVLKSEKADICVIPTPNTEKRTEYIAIFVNKLRGKIYTVRSERAYSYSGNTYIVKHLNANLCQKHALGSKPTDINPLLKNIKIEEREYYGDDDKTFSNENWRDFLESSLVYRGQSVCVRTKDKWIGDYLYNTIHNVVPEDMVLATLGDEANALDKDTYDSIKEMLQSSDRTIVGLGLKTLAEMDYKKYFNTAIHLLNSVGSRWRESSMKNNVSVKYMLKFLDNWDYVRENYSKHIEQEDFDMLRQVIREDFEDRYIQIISSFKNRFPFALIENQHSFNISPNLGKAEDTPEDDSQ